MDWRIIILYSIMEGDGVGSEEEGRRDKERCTEYGVVDTSDLVSPAYLPRLALASTFRNYISACEKTSTTSL